jgi:hypothetical protein
MVNSVECENINKKGMLCSGLCRRMSYEEYALQSAPGESRHHPAAEFGLEPLRPVEIKDGTRIYQYRTEKNDTKNRKTKGKIGSVR